MTHLRLPYALRVGRHGAATFVFVQLVLFGRGGDRSLRGPWTGCQEQRRHRISRSARQVWIGGRGRGGGAGEARVDCLGIGQGRRVDQVDEIVITGRRVEGGGVGTEGAGHRGSGLSGKGDRDNSAAGRLSGWTVALRRLKGCAWHLISRKNVASRRACGFVGDERQLRIGRNLHLADGSCIGHTQGKLLWSAGEI